MQPQFQAKRRLQRLPCQSNLRSGCAIFSASDREPSFAIIIVASSPGKCRRKNYASASSGTHSSKKDFDFLEHAFARRKDSWSLSGIAWGTARPCDFGSPRPLSAICPSCTTQTMIPSRACCTVSPGRQTESGRNLLWCGTVRATSTVPPSMAALTATELYSRWLRPARRPCCTVSAHNPVAWTAHIRSLVWCGTARATSTVQHSMTAPTAMERCSK